MTLHGLPGPVSTRHHLCVFCRSALTARSARKPTSPFTRVRALHGGRPSPSQTSAAAYQDSSPPQYHDVVSSPRPIPHTAATVSEQHARYALASRHSQDTRSRPRHQPLTRSPSNRDIRRGDRESPRSSHAPLIFTNQRQAANPTENRREALQSSSNIRRLSEKEETANRLSSLLRQKTMPRLDHRAQTKPALPKSPPVRFPSFATTLTNPETTAPPISTQPRIATVEKTEPKALAGGQPSASISKKSARQESIQQQQSITSETFARTDIEPSLYAQWKHLGPLKSSPTGSSRSERILKADHLSVKTKGSDTPSRDHHPQARLSQQVLEADRKRNPAENQVNVKRIGRSAGPDSLSRSENMNIGTSTPSLMPGWGQKHTLAPDHRLSTPSSLTNTAPQRDSLSGGVSKVSSKDDFYQDDFKPRRRGRRHEDELEDRHDERTDRRPRARFARRDSDADDDDRPLRRRNKMVIDDDIDPDYRKMLAQRDLRKRAKKAKKQQELERAAARRISRAERMAPIRIPDFVTMTRLAQMLNISYVKLEKTMNRLGFTSTSPDHILSAENAGLAAIEHNFDPSAVEEESRDLYPQEIPADKSLLQQRPPVVAIMGHVDHGKTTLLDYLRKTSVAAGEHGGITQHIGAFSVELPSTAKTITFLDTPGHSAFLAMRQRGAIVTDIIVLVVAADDSVKPQTLEALKHAKEAGLPIIVAINKIDKQEADVQRVKNDLARHGVEIEEFGGDTQVICVSGKTGQGMEQLEEAAVTLSEILDHRADPAGPVEGWVIEATMKPSGRAATVLVRQGTLKVGDVIVAGQTWARVRVLRNEAGLIVNEATPGTPVEVEGWRDQPLAGDEVLAAPSEQKASDVVQYRAEMIERLRLNKDVEAVNKARKLELEKRVAAKTAEEASIPSRSVSQQFGSGTAIAASESNASTSRSTVPFIIKADVSGSAEAINDYVLQMTNPICSPTILRTGVGPVSEFDIEHAAVAEGHIIAFNLARDAQATLQAERRGVKLLYQDVIYRIVADVKDVLESTLPPLITQRIVGEAEIASVFDISLGGKKKMAVAGCRIRNGIINRRSKVRVLRGETKVYEGTITSLKNVKKDVNEMRKGSECGIAFDKWEDFRSGDTVQTYEEKDEKRTLPI